ncbi:zinc finger CCCH domain-containing protein 65-like [Camellia sinensis]|uniref:zinc finger CCCH domain-containing protein 65-like n=1 Tax=Camellia sinensis TaxID=4442 RepID=UPI001035EA7F|nr:zinc finger CCCH domain-containing protein 65-like [Camellia sinensis]
MQLMELEKWVSDCGGINSLLRVTDDEEIEEGEISGDFGVYDQSMDLLLEDAVSLEKKVDEVQNSEAISNDEQFTCKKQKVANQEDTKSNKNFVETIDNVGKEVELKILSNMPEIECKSEIAVFGKYGEAKLAHGYNSVIETVRNEQQTARAIEEFNHPAVPGKISRENATKNQSTLSTEKDAGVHKEKKRGPKTKENKAKKKQKERIKRAEKNRRLGVKRLKIQPILKPKTVSYCRHYMKGRCQEGDKCKFSHDTIPLTKSKACCHFARHSCMKGDDCPFDHQLSKYPCNNYLSNGFCSRGPDCMFSHEMPLTEGSPSTTNASKPELKFSSLLRGTNSEKQLNLNNSFHQKVDSSKNTKQNVVETILKRAVQTQPKGISKLMFGKLALDNPSKLNQVGSSPITGVGGVKVGLPMIRGTPDMAQNSNEITKMTAAVESKGINFLSFGKAPLKDCGIPKSTSFGDSNKDKQAASSPKKDVGLKIGNQTGQITRDVVPIWSEIPKRTPTMPPQGINFLSFGKVPLDHPKDNDVVSSVQERETAPKRQIPSSKSWKQLSSSLPLGQSVDQLTDEHGKDTPSSALKALWSNMPNAAQKERLSNMRNSAQKALMSTLAFAAEYESRIKMDCPPDVSSNFNKESSSSQNTSRGSTILDFLYGNGSKTKQ